MLLYKKDSYETLYILILKNKKSIEIRTKIYFTGCNTNVFIYTQF